MGYILDLLIHRFKIIYGIGIVNFKNLDNSKHYVTTHALLSNGLELVS